MQTMNERVYDGQGFATELTASVTSVGPMVKQPRIIAPIINFLFPLRLFQRLHSKDVEIPVISRYVSKNNINWIGGQYSRGEPR